MKNMQTDNLMALSFLIDEDIYVVKNQEENIVAPLLVAEVAKTTNVIITEPVLEPQKDFLYLGDNNKYILIIVKEPAVDFLKKEDLNFLLKILSAKKLELNDVAIINTEKNGPIHFDAIKNFFACSKIITFGINPKALQIEGAIANKKSVFKNTSILGTWELAKLQQDVSKKTTFWNELKTF
jgi:hypothetical protein